VAGNGKETELATWLLIVIILAALVFALIVGTVVFGIGTQQRDRGVTIRRRQRGPGSLP
jgi:uncharacterized protein YpmS